MLILPFFRRIKIADFDFNKKCRQIAANTEGLSGREIAKLGIAWQVLNAVNPIYPPNCSKFLQDVYFQILCLESQYISALI